MSLCLVGTYLEVLLSMKHNRFGLDFSVLNVNFVTSEDDWDVFTNTNQILKYRILLYYYDILEIRTFGLGSRTRDVCS